MTGFLTLDKNFKQVFFRLWARLIGGLFHLPRKTCQPDFYPRLRSNCPMQAYPPGQTVILCA